MTSEPAPLPSGRARRAAVVLPVLGLLSVAYAAIWIFGGPSADLVARIWYFGFIGVGGAVVANSTGVGGGVVFIPAFNILSGQGVLDLTFAQTVGISFLIQCFGMTVGSLTWYSSLYATHGKPATGIPQRSFWMLVIVVLVTTLPAMLLTQFRTDIDADVIFTVFKTFSVSLGMVLLAATWTVNRQKAEQTRLERVDLAVLAVIGAGGGVVTALFSVGVGELVALYLFIRHYPLNTCVAAAVLITAATVLTGAPYHILFTDIPWEVVVLAVPGAMLGGFLARRFAHGMGPARLKTFAALWIVGSGIYLLYL